MTENELQTEVIGLICARRLYWHLCRDSRYCRGHRGWPDLAIIGSRFAVRELKGDDTRTSRQQEVYGDLLLAAGVSWGIWRPGDLESGRIEAELDALV